MTAILDMSANGSRMLCFRKHFHIRSVAIGICVAALAAAAFPVPLYVEAVSNGMPVTLLVHGAIGVLTAFTAGLLACFLVWRAPDHSSARNLAVLLIAISVMWGSSQDLAGVNETIALRYYDAFRASLLGPAQVLALASLVRFTAVFPASVGVEALRSAGYPNWRCRLHGAVSYAPLIWAIALLSLLVYRVLTTGIRRLNRLLDGSDVDSALRIVGIVSTYTLEVSVVAAVIGTLLLALHNLRIGFRLGPTEDRVRVFWLATGIVVAAAMLLTASGVIGASFLLHGFGLSSEFAAYGAGYLVALAPFALILSAGIAVLQYGAIDPTLALNRTTVVGILGVLGFFLFTILESLLSNVAEAVLNMPSAFGSVAAGVVSALFVLAMRRAAVTAAKRITLNRNSNVETIPRIPTVQPSKAL